MNIFEKLMVPLFLEDIRPSIDKHQYGNVKGSSTGHYLIRLIHNLLTQLDKTEIMFSVVMYDFRKGFYLIDHTIVIQKLLDMGLRPAYAKWLCSFACIMYHVLTTITNAGWPW